MKYFSRSGLHTASITGPGSLEQRSNGGSANTGPASESDRALRSRRGLSAPDKFAEQAAEAERRRVQRLEIAASFALCKAAQERRLDAQASSADLGYAEFDEDALLVEIVPNG